VHRPQLVVAGFHRDIGKHMDNPWPKDHKGHWWSGWPGAYCMRCGADDPMEFAIGNNYYDPLTDKWDTEQHRLEYESKNRCIVDGK
jgi:hypothetical protein